MLSDVALEGEHPTPRSPYKIVPRDHSIPVVIQRNTALASNCTVPFAPEAEKLSKLSYTAAQRFTKLVRYSEEA